MTSSSPTPSIVDGVPLKYFLIKSEDKPTASKICAPAYDWYVEIPIFDITLSIPFPIAFIY